MRSTVAPAPRAENVEMGVCALRRPEDDGRRHVGTILLRRSVTQRCESAAQLFLLPSVNATRFAHALSTQKSATGVYWNGVWQFLPGVVQAELRRRSR